MLRDEYAPLGKSLLHHGPLNQRAYLVRLAEEDAERMPGWMRQLAQARGYTKLLARVPRRLAPPFLEAGFEVEAVLPLYYAEGEDCLYLARYLSKERRQSPEARQVAEVLEHALSAPGREPGATALPEGCELAELGQTDAPSLAALYGVVFSAYPFPVQDADYLRHCMAHGYRYCGILAKGRLAAAACAEPDPASVAVEFSDFATLPEFRQKGLAGVLIRHLESRIPAEQFTTLFTICRATSWGMNRAFASQGFQHVGTLWNNTHFNGGLEDMNIWVKPLAAAPGNLG